MEAGFLTRRAANRQIATPKHELSSASGSDRYAQRRKRQAPDRLKADAISRSHLLSRERDMEIPIIIERP
jgi:hypothetical protein